MLYTCRWGVGKGKEARARRQDQGVNGKEARPRPLIPEGKAKVNKGLVVPAEECVRA